MVLFDERRGGREKEAGWRFVGGAEGAQYPEKIGGCFRDLLSGCLGRFVRFFEIFFIFEPFLSWEVCEVF